MHNSCTIFYLTKGKVLLPPLTRSSPFPTEALPQTPCLRNSSSYSEHDVSAWSLHMMFQHELLLFPKLFHSRRSWIMPSPWQTGTTILVCRTRNCLETGNPTFVSWVNSNSSPALQIRPRPSLHPNHATHMTALGLQWHWTPISVIFMGTSGKFLFAAYIAWTWFDLYSQLLLPETHSCCCQLYPLVWQKNLVNT